jgi:hypothetical protein
MSEPALPGARNEPSDVGFRPVFIGLVATGLSLFALALVALWLFPQTRTDRTVALPLPVAVAPALQADPARDMARFRATQLQELNSSWWVDAGHTAAHIPIDRAMDDIARTGIADWPGHEAGR